MTSLQVAGRCALALLVSGVVLAAQASSSAATSTPSPPSPPPPSNSIGCTRPESRQFDFWLGNWSFVNTANNSKGVNRVSKIHDGCVVFEDFDAQPLKGRSHSVFDQPSGKWKQTWVDNTGAYLDFVGGFADGKMILSREVENKGKKFIQRMVWSEIQADKFVWEWQRSDDVGASWKTLWRIDYVRIPG